MDPKLVPGIYGGNIYKDKKFFCDFYFLNGIEFLAQTRIYLIPVSLQPGVVDRRYFKQ